ncbi:FHIPEP family type III secretion protein, partial [Acinetobacter baumannii]
LMVGAGVLGFLGLVPGMPNLPFLLLGGALGYAAWRIRKRQNETAVADANLPAPLADAQAPAEVSWDDLAPVDPLGIEV